MQSYNETYVKLSPVLVPTLLYAKVGGVLSTSDLLPYNEFLASRFYREWAAPQGIVDALAATLDKSATSYAFIAVQRHERHGLVDAATKRRMGFLVPHFRRAVNIGKVIDLHKVEAAALADTLDGLATAMFLVDRDTRIVRANVAAHSLLSGSAVLGGAGGKLGDTDVLVREDDVQHVRRVLAARGYAATVHCDECFSQFEVQKPLAFGLKHVFDVHWKISTQPTFANLLTYDELIRDTVPVPALGVYPPRGPRGPLHALLLACVHPVMHHQNVERVLWTTQACICWRRSSPSRSSRPSLVWRAGRMWGLCASGNCA